MQAVTGLHRKSLVRLMNGCLVRKPRKRERQKTYGTEVDEAIRLIAKSLDYPCAERLTPSLRRLAEHLAEYGALQVSASLLQQLDKASVSTVERRLRRFRDGRTRLSRQRPPSATAPCAALP